MYRMRKLPHAVFKRPGSSRKSTVLQLLFQGRKALLRGKRSEGISEGGIPVNAQPRHKSYPCSVLYLDDTICASVEEIIYKQTYDNNYCSTHCSNSCIFN